MSAFPVVKRARTRWESSSIVVATLLADGGAEVLKIEMLGRGDGVRTG